jgi:hypothetical protein
MARLFIANCTRHSRKVFYRLDVDKSGQIDPNDRFRSAREITVPAGKGAMLGDLHPSQITSIIDQLKPFGAREANDTGNLPRHTVPYLLSSGAPIEARLILKVYKHNQGVLNDQGVTRRRKAAIGSNEAVNRHMAEQTGEQLKLFEVAIEQQPVAHDEAQPQGKPVEEGFRVVDPSEDSQAQNQNLTRAQRRAARLARNQGA